MPARRIIDPPYHYLTSPHRRSLSHTHTHSLSLSLLPLSTKYTKLATYNSTQQLRAHIQFLKYAKTKNKKEIVCLHLPEKFHSREEAEEQINGGIFRSRERGAKKLLLMEKTKEDFAIVVLGSVFF